MESASLDIRSIRICTSQEEMGMVQTPEPLFVHSEFLKNYTSPCDSIFSIGMMNKLIQRDGTGKLKSISFTILRLLMWSFKNIMIVTKLHFFCRH